MGEGVRDTLFGERCCDSLVYGCFSLVVIVFHIALSFFVASANLIPGCPM
jgi:hypothetical protein